MKFDKESIIAISICMALLIAWPYIFKTEAPPSEKQSSAKTAVEDRENNASPDKTPPAERKADEKPDVPEKTEDAPLPQIPDVEMESNDCKIWISPSRGGISKLLFSKFTKADNKTPVTLPFDFSLMALELEMPGAIWKNTDTKEQLTQSGKLLAVERKFVSGNKNLLVRQIFEFKSDYSIAYKVEMENYGNERIELPELRVSAGGLPPVGELSGDKVRSEYQSVDACLASNKAVASQAPEKTPFSKMQENPALWIAVTNKYFVTALIPEEPFDGGNTIESSFMLALDKATGKEIKIFYMQASGIFKDLRVEPQGKLTKNFTFFAGPKEHRLLKGLAPKTEKLLHFGWAWIEGISQLLLAGLVYLKGFCGSYGLSIILLTVLVKLLFWPFTERANASMKKMQKVQPLIQEIRTKYKDDQQKMNAKIMQLYKEQKINPLGGCLPILLQIPVFLALYNTLDGAIELRHSQFLWANDLSMPDTIFSIPLGFMVLPFNPLVLLMTGTMVLQQKMTPSAADPMQQKMMLMMPFIMLFMLYSLPSGLTLYWTVSQTISILQLLINKYRDKKSEQSEEKVVRPSPSKV